MAKSIYGACDGALSDSTTFIEPWGKDITTFKVEFGNYNRDYGGGYHMLFRRRSGVCDKVEKLTCRCCGKTNKMYIYIVGTNRGPKYKAAENMRMRKHIYFIY